MPCTASYLDDIIVAGQSNQHLVDNLDILSSVLQTASLHCNLEKCQFFLPEVEYLGHVLSATSIRPLPHHVQAMQDLPSPSDVKLLQSILGYLNYCRKFIPHASTIAAPLYCL